MNQKSDGIVSFEIPGDISGVRLDHYLASCPIDLSRSRLQALIKNGNVRVNGLDSKSGYRLKAGDVVTVSVPPPEDWVFEPEKINFSVVHEDNSLIVVNKPPGLVVHPAPGHYSGTLVHGLLYHCTELSGVGGVMRPGIVHRLDKDTSGLIVVAKSDRAHSFLSQQFKAGKVIKEYSAIVHGRPDHKEGTIDLPIARHQKKRKEMSVSLSRGKAALTHWRKIEEFEGGFSLLSVLLKTGRTHQIRVHMANSGHPVAGDSVYGYGRAWWKRSLLWKKGIIKEIPRQMLHAGRLGFKHPDGDVFREFEAPLPSDMEMFLGVLRGMGNIS